MFTPQNANIKNLGAISLQYLKDFLLNAPVWQISVGYWDKVLYTNTPEIDLDNMFSELSQNYANQLLTIKASKTLDKNGNIPMNAEKFRFYMPASITDSEKEESFFELFVGSGNMPLFNNPNNTQQLQQYQPSQFPVILNGMPQNNQANQQPQINLGELFQQFEIKTKNLLEEQRLQYERDKIKDWAERETERINKTSLDAEEKLKAAEELEAKYKEKIEKILPSVGDIARGVIDGIGKFGLDFFNKKTLSGVAKPDEKKVEVKKEEVKKGAKMSFEIVDNNKPPETTKPIKEKEEPKTEEPQKPQKPTKESILKMIEDLTDSEKDEVLNEIDAIYYVDPDEKDKTKNDISENIKKDGEKIILNGLGKNTKKKNNAK